MMRLSLVVAALLAATAQAEPVQVIDNRSFFDNIPHTLIDFETRGDGTPLILGPNRFIGLQPNEYAGSSIRILGSTPFPSSPIISNLGVNHAAEALRLGGSSPNAFSSLGSNIYRFEFLQPVNAFGFTILNSPTFGSVELTLFDDQNDILALETFTSLYVQGTVLGEDFGEIFDWDYGFFGLAVPNSIVSYATLSEDATLLDDLHYGLIPEPSSLSIWVVLIIWRRGMAKRSVVEPITDRKTGRRTLSRGASSQTPAQRCHADPSVNNLPSVR